MNRLVYRLLVLAGFFPKKARGRLKILLFGRPLYTVQQNLLKRANHPYGF